MNGSTSDPSPTESSDELTTSQLPQHLAAADVTFKCDSAEDAARRWGAVDATKHQTFWRIARFSLLAIATVVAPAYVWREYIRYEYLTSQPFAGQTNSNGFLVASPTAEKQIGTDRLNARQKLLLFGDTSQSTKAARIKALWDSEPTNPAYFAEYVEAYLFENDGKLPPDFIKTARRIDPQNAWFTYLAAAAEAKNSVERQPQSKESKASGGVHPWKILDEARFESAMKILREARTQPRCENYRTQMFREKIPLLPQGDLMKARYSAAYMTGETCHGEFSLRNLGYSLAAKAWLLGEAKDSAGFRELLEDSDLFLRSVTHIEPSDIILGLIAKATAETMTKNLYSTAQKLGFPDDAARLKQVSDRLTNWKEAREARTSSAAEKLRYQRFESSASGVALLATQVESPPPLTDDDLKPGRLMEHELYSELGALAVWKALGVCLVLAAAYRLRAPSIRRSARRMQLLMRPVDWCWLMGLGVVLPLFYVMGVNRLTPLGGRDFGVQAAELILPAAHFLGLVVLLVMVPVLVARWRLGLRAGVFGFTRGRSPLGWSAAACVLVFIPVVGWAAPANSNIGLDAALGLISIPALWLLVVALRALFSRSTQLLPRAAVARVIMPAYACGMLAMISMVPFFGNAQQYWFERNTLAKLDPAYPAASRYEYQVAMQLQKELRAVLGFDR